MLPIKDSPRLELLRFALGEELLQVLEDRSVVELSLNDDGSVWVEYNGEPIRQMDVQISPDAAYAIIGLVADSLGKITTVQEPIVEGEFPLDGSRFEGMIPPVVRAGAFSIRKHFGRVIPLTAYMQEGLMPPVVYEAIGTAISKRRNILVVGGTGSGKTTLVNGIIAEMNQRCPMDRLLIAEDTRELQSESPNTLFLRSTVHAPMQMLVKVMLRLRPDRIIVGEVRGGEALDLLMAWNTGHPGGVCTVHANSAAAGLQRLEDLIGIASQTPMPRLIGEAVDLVLYVQRDRDGRKVHEATWCHGFNVPTQNYNMETIYEYSDYALERIVDVPVGIGSGPLPS